MLNARDSTQSRSRQPRHARRSIPPVLNVFLTCRACKGGGRLSQYRDAANLKEPRNATVRCFRVAKTWVHSLLGYLL
ncbi:unnamed protein product [Parnassius mnemosyne]|uniref:Uncharacterized protein n=1 Tax=Parnassius mnemosyne TaxID=213953 RepID=A0AAV1M4C3_9NEOP